MHEREHPYNVSVEVDTSEMYLKNYGQIDTLEMYLDMDILEFDENVSRY